MRLHTKGLTFLFLFLLPSLGACAQTTVEPTPVVIELKSPVFPPTWTPTPQPTQYVITSTPLPEFGTPTPHTHDDIHADYATGRYPPPNSHDKFLSV
ncbi:MAG: hypothetical protein V3T55_10255 [Anaerolineales bacterium]